MNNSDYDKMSGLGGTKPNEKIGLAPDYGNEWGMLFILVNNHRDKSSASVSSVGDSNWENEILERTMRYYEEYIRDKQGKFAEETINRSNPERIQEVNALVDKVRELLPILMKSREFALLIPLCVEVDRLVNDRDFLESNK